jgi:hypothetical protein
MLLLLQGLGSPQSLIMQGFFGGTVAPPPTGIHVRYKVAWDCDTFFVVGANGPFRAVFSRADGANLGLSDGATVQVLDFMTGAVLATPPVAAEGTGAAASQVLSWNYLMARGAYKMRILATFGSEIEGAELVVICND